MSWGCRKTASFYTLGTSMTMSVSGNSVFFEELQDGIVCAGGDGFLFVADDYGDGHGFRDFPEPMF